MSTVSIYLSINLLTVHEQYTKQKYETMQNILNEHIQSTICSDTTLQENGMSNVSNKRPLMTQVNMALSKGFLVLTYWLGMETSKGKVITDSFTLLQNTNK